MIRRFLLLPLVLVIVALLPGGQVSAHNTLSSSTPADGATLATAATEISLLYTGAVPLESVSMEVIDTSAVRRELTGFTHGASGDKEVVASLPALAPGPVTLRWRLVGPDGHVLSGRIEFTIETPTAPTTIDSATPTTVTADVATAASVGFSEPWSTPSQIRWLLRVTAYLAALTVAGVVLAAVFVWPAAATDATMRRLTWWGLAAIAATALAQWLVVAGDIAASAPWSAFSSLSAALETDVGMAMMVRLVIVTAIAALLAGPAPNDVLRWRAIAVLMVCALATWAWAGHAKSLRWPWLGVPLDVAHHLGAASWLGGLLVVGVWATRADNEREVTHAVQRFGTVARAAVIALAMTGVLQSLRLDGGPGALFTTGHGRLVLVKVLLLAAMLLAADVNRRRVAARISVRGSVQPRVLANLRRAMLTELTIGVVIIGVTAGLVVSTPAGAESGSGSSSAPSTTATTAPVITMATTVGTLPSVPIDCTIEATSVQFDDVGYDVECLQQALRRVGVLQYGASTPGIFDAATDAAVRSFQEQQSLLVDGIVGRVTATALGIWPP